MIEKDYSEYEYEVFAKPSIYSTPLFPLLFDYQHDGNTAILTIEEIVPMRRFVKTVLREWDLYRYTHMIVAQFLLDMMGALRTLHSAGFVHADVSPNNIGYNRRTKTWQLYDFDRALPIDVAATVPRGGGTRGFCSLRFEGTGLLEPLDDYISLMLTCQHGLPYPRAIDPFAKVALAFEDSSYRSEVDLDACYMMAFDFFCDAFKLDNIEANPSYIQAMKIIRSMGKRQFNPLQLLNAE